MFGESVWCITKALAIRFGGHKLSSPVFKLSSVKHKHEVNWEPIKVTPNGLLENLSSNTIECSQVAIQHYLLAANQINSFFNSFDGDEACVAQWKSSAQFQASIVQRRLEIVNANVGKH